MKSAQPFYCQDSSLFDQLDGCFQWLFYTFSASGFEQDQLWATLRTGNRLGMIAPVQRIFIFTAAVRTHFKTGHGGVFPVIRQLFNNRIARTAISTVGKWIAVTPFSGGFYLLQAFRTGSNIGRNKNKGFAGCGAVNGKLKTTFRFDFQPVQALYSGQRRQIIF